MRHRLCHGHFLGGVVALQVALLLITTPWHRLCHGQFLGGVVAFQVALLLTTTLCHHVLDHQVQNLNGAKLMVAL